MNSAEDMVCSVSYIFFLNRWLLNYKIVWFKTIKIQASSLSFTLKLWALSARPLTNLLMSGIICKQTFQVAILV